MQAKTDRAMGGVTLDCDADNQREVVRPTHRHAARRPEHLALESVQVDRIALRDGLEDHALITKRASGSMCGGSGFAGGVRK